MSNVDIVMKSEERRALVLLGITAVLASILATMYALIWTNANKLEDFFFNFPCTAVPHLTVYDVPILEALIKAWILYAAFAFFYFSEDWFPSKRGVWFRTICHGLASFFMGTYFLSIVWYIPALYVLIVWIPVEIADLYMVAVLVGLLYIDIRFAEMATGTRGAFKNLLWNRISKPALTAASPRLTLLLARLWNKYGTLLPLQLRNQLVLLRKYIHPARMQRKRLGGRVKKILTYSLGVVAIFLAILYRIYCG